MAVGFAENDFDTLIEALVFLEDLANVRFLRGVVCDAEFPVSIDLTADGLDGGDEPALIDIVNRHQDGDQRAAGEALEFFPDAVGFLGSERIVGGDPGAVGIRRGWRRLGGALHVTGVDEVPGAGLVLSLKAEAVFAPAGNFNFENPARAFGGGESRK